MAAKLQACRRNFISRALAKQREAASDTGWRSHMQLNAFFPSLDIGNDPAKIRDWAQAAEDLGYAYIEVPDHVFGVTARDGWVPLYNEKASFHETFVTLGDRKSTRLNSSHLGISYA